MPFIGTGVATFKDMVFVEPVNRQVLSDKAFLLSQDDIQTLQSAFSLAGSPIPVSRYACPRTQSLFLEFGYGLDTIRRCLEMELPGTSSLVNELGQIMEKLRQCILDEARYRDLNASLQLLFRDHYASKYLDRRSRDLEGSAARTYRRTSARARGSMRHAQDLSTTVPEFTTVSELVRAFDEELAKRGLPDNSWELWDLEWDEKAGLYDTPAYVALERLASLWYDAPWFLMDVMREGTKSTELEDYTDRAWRGNFTFLAIDDIQVLKYRLHRSEDEALMDLVARRMVQKIKEDELR
ncbi:hypothetical protein CMUS01_06811 [Colletotrichum musicola]|uniref:Uncharacterized protein n=1 Tax=Colletotrichum musicola TaxID=2175873 RepID=A0A8H6KJY7_9PEZI|nr:hypothetical protein CMUS01_06811 [Colletotrichum musicola]